MKSKQAQKIIKILQKRYKVRNQRGKPFKVLISCVLSQRTKDETTGPAAERLFLSADTPQKILKLPARKIAKLIYPVGFYNQKAKRIKQICRILMKDYNGRVPRTREKLMRLPGVGGKTADIVLLFSYGKDVIPVDTHVAKISRRLGWTNHKNPEKIREDLHKLILPKNRAVVNGLLVTFGKDICQSPFPKCYNCPVQKLCPYQLKRLSPPSSNNMKRVRTRDRNLQESSKPLPRRL